MKSNETLKSLWDYCTSNNRLVPMPVEWSQVHAMLKDQRWNPNGGWIPPAPLILAAWGCTMPIEKQLRFKEHLEWASAKGQLGEIGGFLRSLTEEQWCHFGEV
jgi:hypothetical protein